MKRLLFVLTILMLVVTGCGIGVSDYDDAVLDGISHQNTGKPEKALADFNRAIDIDPQKADGYLGRANSLVTLGQYSDAIEDYNRAFEVEPTMAKSTMANAYVNRGSAHSHLGQYEKAIADYEKGLELDPEIDDPPSFFQRLFSNKPNTDKGIRKHLESLKEKVKESESNQADGQSN